MSSKLLAAQSGATLEASKKVLNKKSNHFEGSCTLVTNESFGSSTRVCPSAREVILRSLGHCRLLCTDSTGRYFFCGTSQRPLCHFYISRSVKRNKWLCGVLLRACLKFDQITLMMSQNQCIMGIFRIQS